MQIPINKYVLERKRFLSHKYVILKSFTWKWLCLHFILLGNLSVAWRNLFQLLNRPPGIQSYEYWMSKKNKSTRNSDNATTYYVILVKYYLEFFVFGFILIFTYVSIFRTIRNYTYSYVFGINVENWKWNLYGTVPYVFYCPV